MDGKELSRGRTESRKPLYIPGSSSTIALEVIKFIFVVDGNGEHAH